MPFALLTSRYRLLLSIIGIFALFALTGCSRSVVSTEVNADGTWKRTVKLYVSSSGPGNMLGAPPGSGQDPSAAKAPTLDTVFQLPTGAGWKTTRGHEQPAKKEGKADDAGAASMFGAGQNEVYTAERSCRADETLTRDVAIRGGTNKARPVQIANTVTVHRLSPTRLEYQEVVRWVGTEKPPLTLTDDPADDKQMVAELTAALPKDLATPEKLATLKQKLLVETWRIIFGPNNPLLAQMMSMAFLPDSAEREMQRRFGAAADRALEQTYGNALTQEQRYAIARKITADATRHMKEDVDQKTASGPPMPGAPAKKDDKTGDMVALTFSARLPGHIVETNGHADPIAGEVYWVFYSPSVQAGDVTLRAVCETP